MKIASIMIQSSIDDICMYMSAQNRFYSYQHIVTVNEQATLI